MGQPDQHHHAAFKPISNPIIQQIPAIIVNNTTTPSFSQTSNKTFVTEESSLVLETLEEGRHHHYLIPIQVNIVCWSFQNSLILNFESKYLTDLLSFSIFCTFQHHVFLGHLLSFNWVIFHISSFTFLQAARRGRFKKKGTKLHIFMDHIFVARHIKLWDHFL